MGSSRPGRTPPGATSGTCTLHETQGEKENNRPVRGFAKGFIEKKFTGHQHVVLVDYLNCRTALGLEPLLKNLRWALLKHRRNSNAKDRRRMRDLLASSLRSIRAFLLVESFHHFWSYNSPPWAGKCLDARRQRVARSRLGPLKNTARTLKTHRALLLNYFKAWKAISNGIVEGLNNKLDFISLP